MERKTNRDIFRSIEKRIQKSQRKYERQGFTVNLPDWFTELQQRATEKGKRFTKKMLGEAEKLAKNFKRTTVPKAERQAEKHRRKEEREIAKMVSRKREYDDYDFEDVVDEEEEIPDEFNATVQAIINMLIEFTSVGSSLADDLLKSMEEAIEDYGSQAVGKGLEGNIDALRKVCEVMVYYELNNEMGKAYDAYSEALAIINRAVNSAVSLAKTKYNGYGL